MIYWMLYDISDSRMRQKMVKLCKDYGMQRIQKSCFLGEIENSRKIIFEREVSKLLDEEDKACMIPISSGAMKSTHTWGVVLEDHILHEDDVYFV